MQSLAQRVTLDDIVGEEFATLSKRIARKISELDKKIISEMKRDRYAIIDVRERTIVCKGVEIRYKRHYVRDSLNKENFFPVDDFLNIPRYKQMTDATAASVVMDASVMSYREAGARSCPSGVSKSSVYRLVKAAKVEPAKEIDPNLPDGSTIAVQIDEKYVSKAGEEGKFPLYTATIFSGVDKSGLRPRLCNKRILCASSVKAIRDEIDRLLLNHYNVENAGNIYLSGDLARYIRSMPDDLQTAGVRYVPDKWHVCYELSRINPFKWDIKPYQVKPFLNSIQRRDDGCFVVDEQTGEALPIEWKDVAIYVKMMDDGLLDLWDAEDYPGCSQETVNAHYFAPRLAGFACNWTVRNAKKIGTINAIKWSGLEVKITFGGSGSESRYIELEPESTNVIEREALNTSGHKRATRNLLNALKFGDYRDL